jgi:hypothetical protein
MDDDHLNQLKINDQLVISKNLPRPITKPAVQYAAHDFRNFSNASSETHVSGISLVDPILTTRRPDLIFEVLKKKKKSQSFDDQYFSLITVVSHYFDLLTNHRPQFS